MIIKWYHSVTVLLTKNILELPVFTFAKLYLSIMHSTAILDNKQNPKLTCNEYIEQLFTTKPDRILT